MPKGLSRPSLVGLLFAVAAATAAQNEVTYLNLVAYRFPTAQGGASEVLTNNGTGTLTWASPPSPEGLWEESLVLSTVPCPGGWSHKSSTDGKMLVPHSSEGGTGGADTHVHTVTGGSVGSVGLALAGTAAAVSSLSMSGSTQMDNAAHAHADTTLSSNTVGGSPPTLGVLTGWAVNTYSPIHSHAVTGLSMSSHDHAAGTLVGAAHGHAVGTLAIVAGSNLPQYYNLIVCRREVS